MKYVVEMGSVAMIYVHTKFHKDWFRHSKVLGGRGIYTDAGWKSHTPTLAKWAKKNNKYI
jgi:hypothetical protein